MKPRTFEYFRPSAVIEALQLLNELGDDARLLAGGQSLVPLLNLRMATPRYIIGIEQITELGGIGLEAERLVLGALVRHSGLEHGSLVKSAAPLLSAAASLIGFPSIRHRGTLGGSLAQADPAAELWAALRALNGRIVVESSSGGARIMNARDGIIGPYEADIRTGEMITWIDVPISGDREFTGITELALRPGDYATAGAAVRAHASESGWELTAALFGTMLPPYVLHYRMSSTGTSAIIDRSAWVAGLLSENDLDGEQRTLARQVIDGAIDMALAARLTNHE